MASPASVARHPVHPMLIVFPIGLWVFSLIADIVYLAGGPAAWLSAALYTMGIGIAGGLLAAIPGLIDLVTLPPSNVRRVGVVHGTLNVIITGLFIINFLLRVTGGSYAAAFALSIIAVAGLLVSGWLGGTLVYRFGVAVEPTVSEPAKGQAQWTAQHRRHAA